MYLITIHKLLKEKVVLEYSKLIFTTTLKCALKLSHSYSLRGIDIREFIVSMFYVTDTTNIDVTALKGLLRS